MEQKVRLIDFTERALDKMYLTCKTCYSEKSSVELEDEIFTKLLSNESAENRQKKKDLVLDKVLKSGHLSIAEHVNYTFAISGISRVLSHQFVRHRHATFSQKSQRYVTYHKPFEYITPPKIKEQRTPYRGVEKGENEEESFSEALLAFETHMKNCQNLYEHLMNLGIPAEDARYVFPNACETSLVVSFNLRELIHLCNLRLCKRAQWEIRGMMEKVRTEVLSVHPYLKELLVPKCVNCTEYDKCGGNE
jgi:thymidylate synthase (FAD)